VELVPNNSCSTPAKGPPHSADTGPAAGLSVEVVADAAGLEKYVAAWDDLAAAAVEPNVFYESWMLLPALRAFGAGRDLRFLLVFAPTPGRPNQPLLCGFFPLERGRLNGLPVRVLRLWQYVHCYLCTPLLRPGFARECLEAVCRWAATGRHAAALLELGQVSGDGPFQELLVDLLDEADRPALVLRSSTRALLRPRKDAQAYLEAVLSGVKRKKLRRAEEKLREAGPVCYTALEAGGDVESWLGEFLRLEAGGWKGRTGTALGSTDANREFFLSVAREAFRRGRLMLLALELNGRPIAHLLNFLAGEGSFAFKVAFDEDYASQSPGVLLELENIRRVHAGDLRWMDSCTAAGPCLAKTLWAERRVIQTVLVATGRAPGPLVLAMVPLLRWLRNKAAGLARGLRAVVTRPFRRAK
jgi:CelD/BcsL family acetyltransferase involved in cellulose biosynthesis